MLENQGLMTFSRAAHISWTIDDKTCGFIANHNIYALLLVNDSGKARFSMLQESTERIAREGHWSCKFKSSRWKVIFPNSSPISKYVIATLP